VILVDAAAVSASRPGRALFEDLSLTVSSGDRIGIVGINGSGKSTLLRVLSRRTEPESGTVRFGRGVRIATLDQVPELEAATVAEAAGHSWESAEVLERLGMGDLLDRRVDELSGGQAKRVALARALVAESDLLILDEPTNHLDLDAVAWLEDRLDACAGGLVLVTHDRHLFDRVTTRMVELDRGRAYVHEGGYASYLEARAERATQAAEADERRRNVARRELAWLRRGAPARTSKPKAHLARARAAVADRPEAAARTGDLDLHFGTPRLGDVVVELHGVGHRYDGGDWLFRHLDLLLDPRERLGIVGPNGAGKSTLLEVVAGRLDPVEGRVVRGATAQLGYFDQRGRDLDPTVRVRDVVVGPDRTPDWRDAALMEAFWFDGDAQWAPIGTLSGGERRRLQLLLTLAAKPNVLLLDEPTNDLDLDTLRSLEEFLDEWPGALLVVSHDRAFLERTVADVIVMDGTGTAGRRPGGYAAWEEERRARRVRRGRGLTLGASAVASVEATSAGSAPTGTAGRRAGSSGAREVSPSTLRHRMRAVSRSIADARNRQAGLDAELGAAAVEAGGHERLAELGVQLASVSSEIDQLEDEWLALAAEAEERGLEVDG
jgi:ATP-binding cassette subfamily F protein uup